MTRQWCSFVYTLKYSLSNHYMCTDKCKITWRIPIAVCYWRTKWLMHVTKNNSVTITIPKQECQQANHPTFTTFRSNQHCAMFCKIKHRIPHSIVQPALCSMRGSDVVGGGKAVKKNAAYVAVFQSAACRYPHPGKSQRRCPGKTHRTVYRHGVLIVVASCCFVYGECDF